LTRKKGFNIEIEFCSIPGYELMALCEGEGGERGVGRRSWRRRRRGNRKRRRRTLHEKRDQTL
jgi:hypothetical protein